MVVIVVPIYKEYIKELELISFTQLMSILGRHDICIVAPNDTKLPDEVAKWNLPVQRFHKKNFESVDTYNKLVLSTEFYERFIDYEYMLIYQLDAFVFEDCLEHFCKMGYDYIGAPWIRGVLGKSINNYEICWVGNGGFSLRNIKSTINILRNHKNIVDDYGENEDVFFAACAESGYKIAPMDIALTFSFEMEVKKCYELNHKQLPFACHAWHKYDLLFWKPFIESYGYEIKESYILIGNHDELKLLEYQRQRDFADFFNNTTRHAMFKSELYSSYIKGREMYIWGAGFNGVRFCVLFEKCKMKIQGFIDNNIKKHGLLIEQCPIYRFSEVSKERSFILVCVRDSNKEIQDSLKEAGYVYEKDFLLLEDLEKLF